MGQKTGRNAPCPCGSGLKYKKCCLSSDAQRRDPPAMDLDRAEQLLRGEALREGKAGDLFLASLLELYDVLGIVPSARQSPDELRLLFDAVVAAIEPFGPNHEEWQQWMASRLPDGAMVYWQRLRATPLVPLLMATGLHYRILAGPREDEVIRPDAVLGAESPLIAARVLEWNGRDYLWGAYPIDEEDVEGAVEAWDLTAAWPQVRRFSELTETLLESITLGFLEVEYPWDPHSLWTPAAIARFEHALYDPVALAGGGAEPLANLPELAALAQEARAEGSDEQVDAILEAAGLTPEGSWVQPLPLESVSASSLHLRPETRRALRLPPGCPLSKLEALDATSGHSPDVLAEVEESLHNWRCVARWRQLCATWGWMDYGESMLVIERWMPHLRALPLAELGLRKAPFNRVVRAVEISEDIRPETIAELPPDTGRLSCLQGVGDSTVHAWADALAALIEREHTQGEVVDVDKIKRAREDLDEGLNELAALFDGD